MHVRVHTRTKYKLNMLLRLRVVLKVRLCGHRCVFRGAFRLHMYVCVHMYVCMWSPMCIRRRFETAHVCMYVCMYVVTDVYSQELSDFTCMCVCMYLCVYVSACMW